MFKNAILKDCSALVIELISLVVRWRLIRSLAKFSDCNSIRANPESVSKTV